MKLIIFVWLELLKEFVLKSDFFHPNGLRMRKAEIINNNNWYRINKVVVRSFAKYLGLVIPVFTEMDGVLIT